MRDITALAFDPVNPSILYAGTPHLPWKTLDSGAHWQSIASGLDRRFGYFFHPRGSKHPQLVFASACSGIYRSENGGRIMDQAARYSGHAPAYARDRAGPARRGDDLRGHHTGTVQISGRRPFLAASDIRTGELDGVRPSESARALSGHGICRHPEEYGLRANFPAINLGFANHSLTQITGSGDRLYASSIYEGRYGGVFRSVDGGLNWTLRANEEALAGRNLNSLAAVQPEKRGAEDLLFAASEEDILKSADGGKTWSNVANPSEGFRGRHPPHTFRTNSHPISTGGPTG